MYRYLLSAATVLALGVVLLMPSNAEAYGYRHWGHYPAYGYRGYHVSPYRSYYGRPYYYGYSPYYYGYSPYYYGYSPYYYGYSPYYYRPGGAGFSFYVR